jgi:uncharacterized membrane protein HdeD (DUF308 family)
MNTRTKGLLKMLVAGAVILAVGILVMTHTDSFMKIVMIAAGIGTFIDGLYTLNGMKKWKYTDATRTLAMVKGIESVAIGVAAVLVAILAAETALTVMVYIFAISLVFSAVVAFENAATASRFGIVEMRSHFIVEGIIASLVAIILFFRPVETLYKVVQILSIVLIAIGGILVVVSIVAMFKKKSDDATVIVEEAEVVEDKK